MQHFSIPLAGVWSMGSEGLGASYGGATAGFLFQLMLGGVDDAGETSGSATSY